MHNAYTTNTVRSVKFLYEYLNAWSKYFQISYEMDEMENFCIIEIIITQIIQNPSISKKSGLAFSIYRSQKKRFHY